MPIIIKLHCVAPTRRKDFSKFSRLTPSERTYLRYITHIICYILCARSHGQRIVIIIIIIIVFDRSENERRVAVVVSPQSFIFIANKYEKSSAINTCAAHCVAYSTASVMYITMRVVCTLLLSLLLNTLRTPLVKLGNLCVFVRYVCNKNNACLSFLASCKYRIRILLC